MGSAHMYLRMIGLHLILGLGVARPDNGGQSRILLAQLTDELVR